MKSLVYVDNSNVWIEGMHVSAVKRGMATNVIVAQRDKICDGWKIDFGKLLGFAGGEKPTIKRAVLFGSRPPANDSLWSSAKKQGFEVIVYDRNVSNREKKIDTDIVANMMEDSFSIARAGEDEMVLVAGDKDYVPAIEKIRKRKISVIVCFWDHAAIELQKSCDKFISLNPYLEYLAFEKKR